MAEITTGSSSNKKNAGVKKCKKLNSRVDLTPMVDLGFLLVTFFVFTTTMSEARAMNIYEPNDKGVFKPTRQSGAMTLLLGKNNHLFYYYGELGATKTDEQLKSSNYEEIRTLINEKRKHTEEGDLMYIIKSDEGSTLKNAVDILDEMTICGVKPGHYAEVAIAREEKDLMRLEEMKMKSKNEKAKN